MFNSNEYNERVSFVIVSLYTYCACAEQKARSIISGVDYNRMYVYVYVYTDSSYE